MINLNLVIDRRFLKGIGFKIGWLDTYLPVLLEGLKKNKVNVRIDSDGPSDIVHILATGPLTYMRLRKGTAPILSHCNVTNETLAEELKYGRWIGKRVYGAVLKYFTKSSDALICPSEYCAAYFRKIMPGTPITIIPYGIDATRFRFSETKRRQIRKQFGVRKGESMVLTIGAVSRRKGLFDFMELARMFPDVKFVWVGQYYMRESFLKIVLGLDQKNPPDNVIFSDFRKDVEALYSACDVFFFPSYEETQGMVVGEAALCERPILVRDLPVFREWLTPGLDCQMAEDVPGFATQLKTLLSSDTSRLSKNAKKTAKAYFDPDLLIKRLIGVYASLLEK